MTYKELYESAIDKLEKSKITLGEFEKMIAPLNAEVGTYSDTISRAKAIEALTEYGNGRAVFISVGEAVIRIEQLPPAQSERIKGHWIDGESQCGIKCSKCGCPVDDFCHSIDYIDLDYAPNFCPNCGSDNREVTT